ncbi:hypothetical protein CROQUDRAFT_47577, partial [Cronartium quercuum f. sp. fusiforme G11]
SSSDCCWSKIFGSQSDLASEIPLLQMVIEEAGHICLFLSKIHCELNLIELLWAYIKSGMQGFTGSEAKKLVECYQSHQEAFMSLDVFCN